MSILDHELAEQLTDALTSAGIPAACTVTRLETSGPPWNPTTEQVPYACSGWQDQYSAAERANASVLISDAKVFVLVASLAIMPAPGNSISINGSTYSIISVQRDPAGACWEIQARV